MDVFRGFRRRYVISSKKHISAFSLVNLGLTWFRFFPTLFCYTASSKLTNQTDTNCDVQENLMWLLVILLRVLGANSLKTNFWKLEVLADILPGNIGWNLVRYWCVGYSVALGSLLGNTFATLRVCEGGIHRERLGIRKDSGRKLRQVALTVSRNSWVICLANLLEPQ